MLVQAFTCYNPTQQNGINQNLGGVWCCENKNDLLQIVCGYHSLPVPSYGGKIHFKPLEHLQAIEYCRTAFAFGEDPDVDMSMIPDKVKFKLAAIEEAVSLSNWTTITICRALSLQNILLLLAAVLLEKQVIITSPNLGVLSATVLSLIPMILPFEWQSLFLPVLPGKMFDFLDAPVPFVNLVGILHKPANKMRSNNLVHVNLADNQV
ncbi:putative cDENN domain, tripartite DENN domain, DENN domain lobe protein [Helianthus annuus]|nr:putative cDENN domain, tripartite DENN domain, DENN domain lobe protein [Helianthus annuus]